jgi:Ras-related protein Rab-21
MNILTFLTHLNQFLSSDAHQTTLQASYLRKNLTISGVRVTLNIWDTAGQERFHALGPIYYRDSNGAVLVYDVTDPDSLNKVKTWVKELRKMLGNNVSIAIVGNKTDLLQENALHRCPLVAEAQEYTEGVGNAVHYTTSAKQNRGIDELFLNLTQRMIEWQQSQQPKNPNQSTSAKTLRVVDDSELNADAEGQGQGKCSC